MDAAEHALFAESVSRATEGASGDALDRTLETLGWRDALADDRQAAISLLFDAMGRNNATSSALDWLLADALGSSAGNTAVVLPALRSCTAPGDIADGGGTVSGLGSAALVGRDRALVVASTGQGDVAMDLPVADLTVHPVEGIDPALGLHEVTGAVPEAPSRPLPDGAWESALGLGRLALSHELLGAARAMLELARQHALERIQFGRPIATFQAVRHRLAEVLIAIEAAESLVAGAWDEPSPVLCLMAKGMAGRNARTAAKHCQQVLAGIGFTAEHPFHRFYKRVVVLDQLLGAGHDLTRQLGADVLATGSLPPAFSL